MEEISNDKYINISIEDYRYNEDTNINVGSIAEAFITLTNIKHLTDAMTRTKFVLSKKIITKMLNELTEDNEWTICYCDESNEVEYSLSIEKCV